VLWSRVLELLLGRSRDRRLADEVRAHLELLTEEQITRGLPADEASAAARRAFGGVDQMKERHRDQRGLPLLDALAQDVRFAARLLRRDPRFGIVTIGSLALSIGAITFVFSAVNALVLRPLPIADPDSVYFVQSGSTAWSFPDYRELRDRNTTMAGVIGYRISPVSFARDRQASFAWGYLATGNYFQTLGVQPALGRFFSPEDDIAPGAAPVVVLSDACWRSRFLSDPDVVGQTVSINGAPYTIVGVAPPGFVGTEIFYRPEFWVPMMMQAAIEPGNAWLENRGTRNTWVAGRARRGVTREQAEANLSAVAAVISRELGLTRTLSLRLTRPGLVGDALGGPARAVVWGILGLGGLLMLAGCFNLAGLLLARGADRGPEIALRAAIGAGRGRIVRQLTTEALLLSLAGGSLGAGLAWAGAAIVSSRPLPVDLPMEIDLSVDARVLSFAFALSTLVGLLVAIAPARLAARMDVNSVIRRPADGLAVAGRRWALRDLLACLQVVLCVVMLHTCLLAVRGLQRASTISLGWNPSGVALAGLDVGLAGYDGETGRAFQRRVLEEIRRMPGISAAATANSLPLSIDQSTSSVYPESPLPGEEAHPASRYQVSPGFFSTLEIPLRSGREFTDFDTRTSPRVVVINRALAERLFGAPDAVGRRLRFGPGSQPAEVVGVVEDGKYVSLSEDRRPAVFVPQSQWFNTTMVAVVRSARPGHQVASELRGLLARLDPAIPLRAVGPATDVVALPLFPYQAAAAALVVLGLIAAGLMLTGVHALMSYLVVRRQRDIAIRIALGVSRGGVLRAVLSHVTVLLAVGAAAGLLLAMMTGSALSSLALGVSPREPLILAALIAGLAVVVLLSCWGPVRRSLRVDPLAVLREG
jgi:predicted permease